MIEDEVYVMLMMMRADDSYTPATEGCTAEELLACVTADDYDACIAACSNPEEPEEPTGNGLVTVKKVSIPDTQYVALNAVEKSIGTIKLTAGDYDTTVSTIEITKSGLGDANDILNIQILSEDGIHISKTAKLKNSIATVRFSSPRTIKAGKSETYNIVVNLSGEIANGVHDFTVTAVGVTNGTYQGTPVKLGQLITTNYKTKNLTAALSLESSLKAGATNTKFGKVTLTNTNSVSAKVNSLLLTLDDVKVNAQSVKNPDLQDYLGSVEAYIDNTKVGNVTVNNNYLQVSDMNTTIAAGKTAKVELRANNVYAGDDATLDFVLDNNNVVATDGTANERMTSTKDTGSIVLKGLNIEVKNARQGESTQKISASDDEVTLLDLTIDTAEPAIVNAWTLSYENIDFADFIKGEGNSGEVYLWINGDKFTVVATGTTRDDIVFSGATKFTWTGSSSDDTFEIQTPATVKITATIDGNVDNAFTNGRFTFSANRVEINDDNVSTAGMSKATKAGHYTDFVNSSTKLAAGKNVVSSNTVALGKDHNVLSFNLTAAGNDQHISGLKINYTGSKDLYELAESVTLYIGDEYVTWSDESELSGQTVLSIEKNNDSYDLEKGKTLDLYVSIKLNNDATLIDDSFSFSVSTGDIEVVDGNDNTVTIKGNTVKGTTYKVSDVVPTGTFNLGDDTTSYIELVITNGSKYDILLSGDMVLSITQKPGTNVSWENGVATLLNSNGIGLIDGTDMTGSVPNSALTFTMVGLDNDPIIAAEDTVTYRVKIDADRFSKDDVKAALQSLTYGYYDEDGTAPTKFITSTW